MIGKFRIIFFFFSSRRRHTRLQGDWSSDVCSSDLKRTQTISRKGHHVGKAPEPGMIPSETPSGTESGVGDVGEGIVCTHGIVARRSLTRVAVGLGHTLIWKCIMRDLSGPIQRTISGGIQLRLLP